MYQKRRAKCQESTENQVCISLHLQADQQRKSFTTQVVFLKIADLFLAVLAYIHEQHCSHKA